MSKFDSKKVAVALAFAALFGNKTSAMNKSKSEVKIPQTIGAVRNLPKKTNWGKIIKIVGFVLGGVVVLEAIRSIFGVFTGLGIGKGSIGGL